MNTNRPSGEIGKAIFGAMLSGALPFSDSPESTPEPRKKKRSSVQHTAATQKKRKRRISLESQRRNRPTHKKKKQRT